ncbi:phage tail assembly protein [Mesorhizobium sp. B2-5-9]|uniref:phage tail assembly protein n=1 Tax=Mesorhizobium sp. B2-5-9 TaxID=2589921 RepID=UPI00112DBE38|nr:phage tail assembly protein [Mesorhizobium sp. B2-5-9]TPK15158.1 phage tail assembly protein [Mesorhizobium sp. B2-5-9]
MDSITIQLTKPITHGEGDKAVTYKELTFREAVLGDLIAGEAVAGGSETGRVAATLAAMADVPYPVFKKMSARDFVRINEATAGLVGNGEADGTN